MPTCRRTNHTQTLLSTLDSRTPEQPIFYDASTTQREASVCTPCSSRGMAVCFECTSLPLRSAFPPPGCSTARFASLCCLCVFIWAKSYTLKSQKFLTPAHLSLLGGVDMLICRCGAALRHLRLLILVSVDSMKDSIPPARPPHDIMAHHHTTHVERQGAMPEKSIHDEIRHLAGAIRKAPYRKTCLHVAMLCWSHYEAFICSLLRVALHGALHPRVIVMCEPLLSVAVMKSIVVHQVAAEVHNVNQPSALVRHTPLHLH